MKAFWKRAAKRLKRVLDWAVFLLTARGPIAKEAEELGLLTYERVDE